MLPGLPHVVTALLWTEELTTGEMHVIDVACEGSFEVSVEFVTLLALVPGNGCGPGRGWRRRRVI